MPTRKVKYGSKSTSNAISYLHGRIEAQLEGFANSSGIPLDILTSGLATLLWPEGQRSEDPMPSLRRDSTSARPTTRKVEVASDARGRKTSSGVNYKNAAKSYWDKLSPQERAAESARRNKKRIETMRKKAA